MRILAIETSCDETAIAILACGGDEKSANFRVLGNALVSQIDLHQKYGGVFPAMAKREHAKNLVPILEKALEEAGLLNENVQNIEEKVCATISYVLAREPGLSEKLLEFISKYAPPNIDVIAVTTGPGLEPALWVGINFAKALALIWNKPIVSINHMEGHILSALAKSISPAPTITYTLPPTTLPILGLLISGGHTELVLMREWLTYELLGQTLDDAVGEAFDKVARMLELPYPGGPEISKLAELARQTKPLSLSTDSSPFKTQREQHAIAINNLQPKTYNLKPTNYSLPRPMLHSNNLDFSFSGLKTAVLYLLKKIPEVGEKEKIHIAHEFENAVTEVLWKKTAKALSETGAQTLVIGGGVSANTHIRRFFKHSVETDYPHVSLHIPSANLSTDNAIMIAIAGFYHAIRKEYATDTDLTANGNLSLAKK